MKYLSRLTYLLILLLCAASLTVVHADGNSGSGRILIVKSRDILFYTATTQGFIQGLESRGYVTPGSDAVTIVSLTGNKSADDEMVKGQLSKGNSLVFTLGTDATLAVQDAHPTVPCIFSMILDPVSLGIAKSLSQPGGNFTGTTLLVSPGKQLEALQGISSQVKTIGVLYTGGDPTSIAFLSVASDQARQLGMTVDSVPITDYASSGKAALEQLAGHVDAFWLIVDPSSASPQAVADTLDVAKRHNLPVLGMSSANVHEGALLSLSANLRDLGDVDAEMAGPILNGTASAAATPIRGPRQTMLSLNLGAAKALGETIPDSVLHLADEVIDTGDASASGN